jgi:hypothetical protein
VVSRIAAKNWWQAGIKKLMLGNFRMHGVDGVVSNRHGDVSLLALVGKIGKSSLQFLLDSGASANFIAK